MLPPEMNPHVKASSNHKTIHWHDLGRMPYNEAWDLQKRLQKQLIGDKLKRREDPEHAGMGDILLFVEHPHVYTLGKSGKQTNLLANERELAEHQAEFVKIDRGGDITYHGPGQIVGYPIFDLDRHFTDIHRFLRYLEEAIIRVCAEFGLIGERIEKLTGVWVDGKKVCAMGIKCSRWVTMHGFALNVNTQLDYFGHIVPCGITDRSVTSLSELLGRRVSEQEVKPLIVKHMAEIFDVNMVKLDELPARFLATDGFS